MERARINGSFSGLKKKRLLAAIEKKQKEVGGKSPAICVLEERSGKFTSAFLFSFSYYVFFVFILICLLLCFVWIVRIMLPMFLCQMRLVPLSR